MSRDMSATDIDMLLSCAACGKEECGDITKLKACTACNLVKYCSRDCQIAHRKQHKKACKKRAAELHDEKLFADPPPPEECPICLLPLPNLHETCCGKQICHGCIYAMSEEGKGICAFCRAPQANSDEETMKQIKKLTERGNAEAFYLLAGCYYNGTMGMPQDDQKANELYLKSGGLGCTRAYYNLGVSYHKGRGVESDTKKAKYYFELAAMKGHIKARHNVGVLEFEAADYQRAKKHFIIAAKAGNWERGIFGQC